jgi:hypothetical protein
MAAADQNVLKAYHAEQKYEPQARSTLIPTLEIVVIQRCLFKSVTVRKIAQVTEQF